jgi:hypothetical protein
MGAGREGLTEGLEAKEPSRIALAGQTNAD